MFCTQCGTQNPDNFANCSNCGAPLGNEAPVGAAPQQPGFAPEAPKKPGFDPVALFNQFRASKYFIPGVAGGAAALLLIIVLILVLAGGGGKTKPIDKYLNGIVKQDIDKYLAAFPEEAIEYLEDETRYFDVDDLEEELEYMYEIMEEDIGDKIKVKFKVVEEDELSEKKLNNLKDSLHDYYGLSRRDLTEAWEIEVEIVFSGSDDDQDGELTFTVIKYDGKWYLSPNQLDY